MGTNYYLYQNVCPQCGRGDESYHIGKSSGGWCFSVHVDPVEGINSLGDLQQKMWETGTLIKDEYGTAISAPEMLAIITERNGKKPESEREPLGYASWDEFHRMNHSQREDNNLLRHQIDGGLCVGHGDGTWDLLKGDFS